MDMRNISEYFHKGWLYIKDGISKERINENKIQDELISYRNYMKETYNIDICEGWSNGL